MIRKFQILPAMIVALSLQFGQASAQDRRGTIPPPSIVATPAQAALSFHAAAVGIASSSAQKLTASFDVSGYSGSFTPTGALHYGHDYVIDTLKCTVSGSSETCKVTISFIPTLPGARKDALLLKDGATTLATVLLGGIGQSPLALIQPGIVTSPVDTGGSYYIYQSVVDENGTVYYVADEGNAVYSYTKAGILTELPITGLNSPHAIAIDGAGTLYIAQNEFATDIVTYTADGVQGTITVIPPAPPYVPCSGFEYLYSVAVDQGGNLFVLEIECGEIFELKLDGAYVTTAISPTMTLPSEIAIAANDNLFIGGGDINKLTAGGVQTQINTVGALEGVAADAASTVYATRYTGGGVAELPASAYSTSIANLDPTVEPLGESVGSDGTVYVGNYYNLDKVDRAKGAIAFGEQEAGVKSTVEDVSFYNGGNESLTLSTFTRSGGAAFALETASTKPCKNGLVLAAGAYCQVAVTMTAPHAGTFSGAITFTSNSLNATGTEQKVTLSGYVYGVWATASPTSLAFGSQTDGTTSPAKTVTLTNHGDLYSATFGTPVAPSGFNVGLGNCTTEIPVGSSCELSVTFNPTDPGAYGGTVTVPVSSNGGGVTPSVTFTVNGTGVAAAALAPAIEKP